MNVLSNLLWSNGYYLDRITPFGGPGNCTSNNACRPDPSLAGFQEHLAEPVDPAELVGAVARLGGRRGMLETREG